MALRCRYRTVSGALRQGLFEVVGGVRVQTALYCLGTSHACLPQLRRYARLETESSVTSLPM